MEELFKRSAIRVSTIDTAFIRYLYDQIEWSDRLIGVTGARGTGKTTMILQYIKLNYGNSYDALYVSMDDYYFTNRRLFDLAEEFYVNGGRYLFIDEIHKYKDWSRDIKNLYDTYTDLKIVFSGSSALQLYNADADLSRRAAMYNLNELSFREYLNLTTGEKFEKWGLQAILEKHHQITPPILEKGSVLPAFHDYLKKGVYPFFIDSKGQFYDRLISTIDVIIKDDLPSIANINYQTSDKLRKLISLIADSVPFKINISELSRKSGISRDVLLQMLNLLDRANLVSGIRQKGAPTGHLTKPDKLYLNNTVLLYALNTNRELSIGTVRETFFMNQMLLGHSLNSVDKGDFLIDNKYVFEIGGKSKTNKQIIGMDNSFVVADDIEHGYRNTIPLWLFGFLY